METSTNTNISTRTKKLAVIAMLSAMAFVIMTVGRIPFMSIPGLTLRYDPKDVIIIIGGFIYGPLAALAISLLSSLVEMVSVSETGPIGFLMNVVSSCSFACIAALIYKRMRTINGAVIGLTIGCVFMTVVMVLWNYIITPLYIGIPRSAVVPHLFTFFLPFNMIKGGINAAVTMIIYKPAAKLLRSMSSVPAGGTQAGGTHASGTHASGTQINGTAISGGQDMESKKVNYIAVVAISATVIAICAGIIIFINYFD